MKFCVMPRNLHKAAMGNSSIQLPGIRKKKLVNWNLAMEIYVY